ncbi:MAG: signal peptidase I [Bdellovibrionales bacterium]|nr:signal peptidase I [Bdellovibrionales bacterium]
MKGSFFEGIGSMGLAVLVALSIRWLLIEAYVIPSGSMLPSLLIHDHIFVNKIVYGVRIPFGKTWILNFTEPERNDVIVFRFPRDESTYFIKRVIGIPGDKVFYENGQLYINDQLAAHSDATRPEDFEWVRDFELPGGKSDYEFYDESIDGKSHSTLKRRGDSSRGSWGPEEIPEGFLFVMGDNRDNSNDSRGWGFVPKENVLGKAMFVWLSCDDVLPTLTFLCDPREIRWKRLFHWIE